LLTPPAAKSVRRAILLVAIGLIAYEPSGACLLSRQIVEIRKSGGEL
jgi:hypothetical protein